MSVDKMDVWADAVVTILLEEEHLELVSSSSRADVVSSFANALTNHEDDVPALSEALMDCKGVAELLCDDDTLQEIIDRCEPPED